jgi:hypothetical protein
VPTVSTETAIPVSHMRDGIGWQSCKTGKAVEKQRCLVFVDSVVVANLLPFHVHSLLNTIHGHRGFHLFRASVP